MTRTSDGAPDPVTEHMRGADLRVRAPQSAIPTQGGPAFPPPPRSGPFPARPHLGPPSGPAQRSPMLTPQGRPTPQHPSGEQTPLHDDGAVPVKVRLAAWGRQAREVATTPAGRWSLFGIVGLVQVFLLFSAVMWWMGGSTAIAESKVAPMTWTGIVHDTGPAGVYLRSEARVDPSTTKDTAAQGSRLALSCGITGDEVRNGSVHTATWLKTTDGLLVSMLYVSVPGRQSIPSCADSTIDAPLLAVSDPVHPNQPPPPGATLSGDQGGGTNSANGLRSGADDAAGPASNTDRSVAAPVRPGAPVAPPGRAAPPPSTPTASAPGSTTSTPATATSGNEHGHHHESPPTSAPATPVG